jgi:hypothetical protein
MRCPTPRGALKNLDNEIATLDAAIESAVKPKSQDIPLGPEIRAHFKAKPLPISEMLEMLRNGHGSAVSAVLAAPYFLSGMSIEQHAKLRDLAEQQFAGPQYEQRAHARKARDKVEVAMKRFTDAYVKASSYWTPRSQALAKVKEKMK